MRAINGNTSRLSPSAPPFIPSGLLTVASINTGHQDPASYAHLILHLKSHIVLLQELKQITPVVAEEFSQLLPTYTLHHNSTTSTNGVGILVSTSLSHLTKPLPSLSDTNNRLVSVSVKDVCVKVCGWVVCWRVVACGGACGVVQRSFPFRRVV
jgi:hypothetical protein